MMYPFLRLNDNTEFVHSDILEGDRVKVYIERPVYGGFKSAMCCLPEYQWDEISGFNDEDIESIRRY